MVYDSVQLILTICSFFSVVFRADCVFLCATGFGAKAKCIQFEPLLKEIVRFYTAGYNNK